MAQGRLMPIIVAAIAVVFSIVWITTASSIGAPPFFMLFGTVMVLIVVFIFGRNLVRGIRRSPWQTSMGCHRWQPESGLDDLCSAKPLKDSRPWGER